MISLLTCAIEIDIVANVEIAVVLDVIAAVTVVIKGLVVDLTALVALKLDINALLTLNGTIISIQACANLIVAVLVVSLPP